MEDERDFEPEVYQDNVVPSDQTQARDDDGQLTDRETPPEEGVADDVEAR